MSLQASLFQLEDMGTRLDSLERHIQREANLTNSLLRTWQSDQFRAPPDAAKQNLDLQRKIKSVSVHLDDLRDRAAAKVPQAITSHPSIDQVSLKEKELQALLSRGKELDAQLAAFQGLPTNLSMARGELDALRHDLQPFVLQCDAEFESLVEPESPVRRR